MIGRNYIVKVNEAHFKKVFSLIKMKKSTHPLSFLIL